MAPHQTVTLRIVTSMEPVLPDRSTDGQGLSRRRLLRLAGTAGVAVAAMGACAKDPAAAGPTSSSTPNPATPPSPAPNTVASSPPAPVAPPPPEFNPVSRLAICR